MAYTWVADWPTMIAYAIEIITTILTIAGIGYYLLAIVSAWAFARASKRIMPNDAPAVSILKPVKGLDPDMYESFRSHCQQQYAGSYEILFGVNSLDDPAVRAVEQLKAEFPDVSIRLALCPQKLGTNGKVSNLVQMLPQASYGHIIINDSDIKVGPHYLQRVMASFSLPHKKGGKVGMVTAPYRGRAHGTVGSKMEALGISTDFIAGVLTARMIEGGIRFALGSTLAISPEALRAIGGLEPLVDYLADDYEMGVRVSRAGFEVTLCPEVVETDIPAYNFAGFLRHQIRWGRSTRDSRRFGYAGLCLTFGLPWALLNVVASGFHPVALWLFTLALLARLTLALNVGVGVLRDEQVLRDLWLVFPRDLVALGLWIWSFAGNTVVWRGEVFALKNGKLHRVTA
jgi:ceramide glucosyltransferase